MVIAVLLGRFRNAGRVALIKQRLVSTASGTDQAWVNFSMSRAITQPSTLFPSTWIRLR
jgi:hypothetical protein